MKTLKTLIVVSFLLFGWHTVWAQVTKKTRSAEKAAKTVALVKDQNFLFDANYAYPMGGPSRSLNFGYDLVVSKDTIRAYLPYFGVSHVAPIDPADGGVKFTWTKFDYKSTVNKKGMFDILITPKTMVNQGSADVRYIRLSISPNGYATLSVTSNNRDPISYNGTIGERDKKKEN